MNYMSIAKAQSKDGKTALSEREARSILIDLFKVTDHVIDLARNYQWDALSKMVKSCTPGEAQAVRDFATSFIQRILRTESLSSALKAGSALQYTEAEIRELAKQPVRALVKVGSNVSTQRAAVMLSELGFTEAEAKEVVRQPIVELIRERDDIAAAIALAEFKYTKDELMDLINEGESTVQLRRIN